ncbi:MAG: helix-turn-helix domain-containing protein, partial [Bacteroidota bacterium]
VIFFAVAIIVGGFASLILFWQRANQPANRFLSLLLLFTALWLLGFFFATGGLYQQNPNLYFKPIFYSFAFGPLIYFFVRHLVDRKASFSRREWWHFLLALLQGGLYWYLTFQDYDYRRWFWLNVHRPYTQRIEFIGTFLSLSIYLILSVLLLRKYQRWLQENESEVSQINLNWLRIVLGILFIWSGQWLLEIILREFFNSYYEYDYAAFILTVLIIVVAIGSLFQRNIKPLEISTSSPTTPEIDQDLLERITIAMAQEKYYLDPKLNLKTFAGQLSLPSRTVSEHLNHGLKCSFIDFVNQHRVEEVKKRLHSKDRELYSILGIALESGFNSKATFHRVFKQFTGSSPGDFK